MKKLAARILGIFFAFAFSFLVVAMTGPLLISSLDSSQGGRVSAATLPAPALVSPANGEAVTGGSVSFVWEAVEGAVDYKLVVSTSTKILDTTKYKCNVNTGGGDVTSYVDAGYLGNGMKYYWWVWAYAADGSYSDWSEVSANGRWFTNPPIQIGAPALISPGLGEAVSGGSIAFQWNAVEGAVDYLLVVSKSTRPLDTKTQKSAIRVGNVTGYTDTGYPANGTKYYWWVWAYNPSGVQSAWSEVSANGRWFTSLPIQIGAPALRSPGNGEALSGSSVLFQWNAVEGAVDYVLIVSRSERPLDPVTNKLA
ncbi:MAG: hypothetical protein JW753_06630, partial [Dehalococcoidia bacterium]|nr:hypothetical protein [Dehalococcoidia bacterium]